MSKVDVSRTRLRHHVPDDCSMSFKSEAFAVTASRPASARWNTARATAFSVVTTDDTYQEGLEIPRKIGSPQKKLADMCSKMNVVNQTNALLRERLAGKSQPASLTRENLMLLEDTIEHNRPAEQLRRKREFIQKEMEKSRQNAGSAEAKAMLLRKITEREEKAKIQKEVRADSVLDDLRRTRFRRVAQMAQKRLQSMSPDFRNLDEGLSTQLDWYLRFCGEEGEEEVDSTLPEEGVHPPDQERL